MIDYRLFNEVNGVVVVVVRGRLNSEGSQFFWDCIEGQIEDGNKKLVVDCSEVEYISSVGLGALVRAHSRMKKMGGNVKLAAVRGIVIEAIQLVGLGHVFHIYSTVAEACAAFEEESAP